MPEAPPDLRVEVLPPARRAELTEITRAVLVETDAQKKDIYDETFWRWQYDGGYSRNLNVVAIVDDRIAGSYPNVILPLRYAGRTVTASVCQDLLTDPAHRGLGIYARMGDLAEKVVRENGVAISYAFPNHRSIPGFLEKHHHTLVAEVPVLIKPTSAGAALRARAGPLAAIAPLRALGDIADLPLKTIRGFGPGARWSFDRVGPDGVDAIDAIWARFADTAPIQLVRDAAFVRWRFLERPHTDYRVFVLHHDGIPVGYAALRLYELFGLPVCLLMDFMVKSVREHLTPLLHHVEGWAARHDAALVVTLLLADADLRRALTRRLYVPVPSRLNRRKFNLVARANLKDIDPKVVADRASWHVTFADWDVL